LKISSPPLSTNPSQRADKQAAQKSAYQYEKSVLGTPHGGEIAIISIKNHDSDRSQPAIPRINMLLCIANRLSQGKSSLDDGSRFN